MVSIPFNVAIRYASQTVPCEIILEEVIEAGESIMQLSSGNKLGLTSEIHLDIKKPCDIQILDNQSYHWPYHAGPPLGYGPCRSSRQL
jgi:hypothetical protein